MGDLKTYYSITLDKRRQKAERKNSKGQNEGLYPVRLRVYNSVMKKDKRYPLDIHLWESDYTKIYHSKEGERLNANQNNVKIKLNTFETKAKEVIDRMDIFTFDEFERKYFRSSSEPRTASYHYNEKIQELKNNGKVSTAESYELSLKSIDNFLKTKGKKVQALRLAEIDKKWLKDYERFMLMSGKSKTTIGIYLRPLQHIFNNAIHLKDIAKEYYPFGKSGYSIPKGNSVKKALNKDQLKALFQSQPSIEQQEKAKDFWFLSYSLNGINIHDLAMLKFSNLHDDRIEFIRAKTKDTGKEEKLIRTYLNDVSKQLINKYKRQNPKPNDYLFEIIEQGMTPEQIKRKVKVFTRFINQHIKVLAQNNDLPKEISCYWARHSFATIAVNKGASLEFMSEALGHSDLKTTQGYFAGFSSEIKKDFAQTLFDF